MLAFSCVLVTACKKVEDHFPTLPTTSATEETSASESQGPDFSDLDLEITIASPLSNETCQYLAKLYVAKSQGLLGEGVTGDTVDLALLDSIDLPFVLKVYSTAETGCNLQTLQQWQKSGSMPDIFLTDSFDQVVSSGMAQSVSRYCSDDPLFSADRIYPQMLSEFFVKGDQYGIPFQTSAVVLFCDMEVLGFADISAVNFRQSRNSLDAILSSLKELNEDKMEVLPFYMASDMLMYLPCAMYSNEYLHASSEDDRANDAFTDSVSYITSLIQKEYAYESLNEEQEKELFDGLSPLLSRKVGVWVGSTDELLRYDNYMPYTLSMMQLPGYNEDEYTPPLLISYPLCISESCENPDEVSAFASFIALDEDALLLTSRLQPREGFLPSVSQPAVWKSVTDRQKYGIYLSLYRDMMYQAIYIPAVSESENFASDMKYVTSHMEALFNLEEDD